MIRKIQKARSTLLMSCRGKCVCIIVLLLSLTNGYAQDLIYAQNGETIKCKIQKVDVGYVSYKDFGLPDSQKKFLLKDQIIRIKYSDGHEENFKAEKETITEETPVKPKENVVLDYDVIYTTEKEQLKVIVKEVDEKSINYSKVGETGVDKIDISKVLAIRYSNGFEEYYALPETLKETLIAEKKADTTTVALVRRSDLIKLRNGNELNVRVVEVDENNVKYADVGQSNAQGTSIAINDILKITYANGYEEVYTQFTKPSLTAEAPKAKPVAEAKVKKEAKEKKKRKEKEKSKPEIQPEAVAATEARDVYTMPYDEASKKHHYTVMEEALKAPSEVQYLELTRMQFKNYPQDISNFKNVIVVDLSQNKIKSFPLELFDLQELRYVWMDNNELQNIKVKDIDKVKQSNIRLISMEHNRLSKFPSFVFGLNNLEELKLNENKISEVTLDKNTDVTKSKIEFIELKKNKLGQLPWAFEEMPKLINLDLSGNNIKTIESDITGFQALQSLNLSSNPLKSIGKSFYNLTSLEELNLNQTLLTTLPDSIGKLSKLKSLVLPGSFYRFPSEFGKLKRLNELYINNGSPLNASNYTGFPAAVYDCTGLKTLSISGVNLYSVGPDISKLKRMESLYLNDCKISECSGQIFSLPNLKVLDLSNNKISKIDFSSMSNWSPIKTLNLENSSIDVATILLLRRNLPYAKINYFDSDFGLNFSSQPLPEKLLPGFRKLFAACDKNDPSAYYELGSFFKDNKDYGLAVKAFRAVAENPKLEGTGKSMVCKLTIAEIYDDVDNVKPYSSPYKRKKYSDYTDYLNTSSNNKAYKMYLEMSDVYPKDEVARNVKKKACARAAIISNEIADNLVKIYDYNKSEVVRLIGGSGDMKNVAATGEKFMNDSAVYQDQTGILIGGLANIFGKVSSSVKDDKAERIKKENERIKAEIASLRNTADVLLAK
ncbi:leucine-rich repeat domain-containing protein [Flavobacterium wongokense]|uniref:leucine-rich repeat domain-containing protein n=1 Tax=Flavobacterium wongokense TaxID=2910674 RepID=UPI001F4920E9|nr:leucine-rich repeat domain-containing protein [Flavobacterium sp. WG47]MCF6130903.1 leucine-rich repeat domain-containing protein [Flavobacterium sp. WG47]